MMPEARLREQIQDLQNYCRLCLRRDSSMTDIFEGDSAVQFAVRIMACASLEVQPNDLLPHSVCLDCQQELDRSYAFRTQCNQTESKVLDHLRLIMAGFESRLFDDESVKVKVDTPQSADPDFQSGDYYDGEQQPDEPPNAVEFLVTLTKGMSPLLAMDVTDDGVDRSDGGVDGSDTGVDEPDTSVDEPDICVDEPDICMDGPDTGVDGSDTGVDGPDTGVDGPDTGVDEWNESLELKQEPVLDISTRFECLKDDRTDEIGAEETVEEEYPEKADTEDELNISVKRRRHYQYYKVDQPDGISTTQIRHIGSKCVQVTIETPEGTTMELQCYGMGKSDVPIVHQMKALHKIGLGKGYFCEQCNKWNPTKSSHERHLRMHTGEKPFSCDTCGKSFVQKEILKRHMMVHLSEAPFPCGYCDKTFRQKDILVLHHLRQHTKDSQPIVYQCPLCDKEFKHNSGLSRHVATHKGRCHTCTVCNREFTDMSALRRHRIKVHQQNLHSN